MKKYTVIPLSCQGRGKKIYKNGDEVTDANFAPGHAEILEQKGYLKCTGEVEEEENEGAAEDDNLSEEELLNKKYSELVAKGKEAMEAKQWADAVEHLTAALAILPGDQDIYSLLQKAKKKAK